MSIITIVAKPPITTVAYFKLHQLLRRSIAQIKSSVQSNTPIFNEEIFDNNYEEKIHILRKLLEIARKKLFILSYLKPQIAYIKYVYPKKCLAILLIQEMK